MTTLIYRKSDKLIVGTSTPPQPVGVEIQNVLNSELGGDINDYGAVEASVKADDEIWVVSEDGSVSSVANPVTVTRKSAQASAQTKLQALGFTDEEIEVLRG